ncbi:PAS domain-containing protein [Levilinea saccharolytica]|uniref:Protein containing PAS domain S-box n=1 Tax=Levilinea saccharolytica TaxID=229921 RepID=A0A0P6Y774_9CHLR|nr:PAS domain S-box protein [Levilinea saccharolytica]KPL77443.1 hypothetical protein ADN01_16260 [Levilinea saccharolytica]GAP18807.1 protein containing PAS domain S-box [Levilinea saccharolytica]
MTFPKFSQRFQSNLPNSRRVSGPLLVFLFTALALLFVSAGYWFYTQQAQSLHAQKTNELQSIAALKVQQIIRWRMERLTDARMNSTSPFFNQALQKWLADPTDDRLTAELLERLQMITVQEEYQNVILTDPQGNLLLSADPQVTSLEADTQKLAAQAAASGEIRMADFARSAVSGKVTLAIAAPFSDGQQPPAAVIVFQIDPEEYLYPLIQSWPVPSQSAETLLVQKQGTDVLFLNTLRFRSDPPLTIRIPLTETQVPAVRAALGRTGEFEGLDYRGVQVLSHLLPIPDTPWFMVAKVDQAEILTGVRSLGLTVLLVVLLSVLMTAVLAVYTFNHRHRVLLQNLLMEEQQRRQAQEETRTTLYSIGDGVICTDGAGLVTLLNPIAEALTGWSEAEAKGKPLAQIFHIISEETRLRVENPVERVLREGSIVGLANRTLLIHRDGGERPIVDSSAPIRSAEGKITGVVLVFRDQTEERAAQRERALLNFTISTSLNEIYLFDAQTLRFRFANDGAIKNLGYSMDQLHGMTPLSLKPEFTAETFRQKLEPLLSHDTANLVFETFHQRADGSRYPVDVHLQLFEYEGEQVFLAVINDITERRQAEEALRKSESIFKKIFEILPIGLWLADKDGTLIQGNPAGVKIWGMEPKVSQSDYGVFKARRLPSGAEIAPDDWALAHTVNEGVTVVDELLEIDAFDGKTKIILNYSAPILDSSGQVEAAFVVNQDVTERYQAEEALQASEERFRVAQEMSPDGFTILHPLKNDKGEIIDFTWIYENQVIARINGRDPQEVIGKRVLDLFPTYRGTSFFQAYIHTALTGNPEIIEDVYVGDNFSRPKWLRLVIVSMGEDIAVHAQDITVRKQAEMRINEQLNELKRWQKATLGREGRVLELKREVNELLTQMGQPPRYHSPDSGESQHDNLLS